jgi:hypothetical protein
MYFSARCTNKLTVFGSSCTCGERKSNIGIHVRRKTHAFQNEEEISCLKRLENLRRDRVLNKPLGLIFAQKYKVAFIS